VWQRRVLISVREWSCVEVRSTRCALSARPAARFPWLSIESSCARATWGRAVRVCELILLTALSWCVTSGQRMVVCLAWCTTVARTAACLARLVIEGRGAGASLCRTVRRAFAFGCVRHSWPVRTMSSSQRCPSSNGAKAPTGGMRPIPHVDMHGHVRELRYRWQPSVRDVCVMTRNTARGIEMQPSGCHVHCDQQVPSAAEWLHSKRTSNAS
jgi:hypothetical protein